MESKKANRSDAAWTRNVGIRPFKEKKQSREAVAESFLQTKHWVILIRLILWTAECQRYDSRRRRFDLLFLIPSRALYLGIKELPTIAQTIHSSIITFALWIHLRSASAASRHGCLQRLMLEYSLCVCQLTSIKRLLQVLFASTPPHLTQPRHSQRSSLNQVLYELRISLIWIRIRKLSITLNQQIGTFC